MRIISNLRTKALALPDNKTIKQQIEKFRAWARTHPRELEIIHQGGMVGCVYIKEILPGEYNTGWRFTTLNEIQTVPYNYRNQEIIWIEEPKMTAKEQYQSVMKNLKHNLKTLAETLEDHQDLFLETPNDWEFAGDLNMVNERVKEILQFIGKGEQE